MPNQRRPGLARIEFYTEAQFKAEFVAATVRNGETVTGALIRLMQDYTQNHPGAIDNQKEPAN
jgi:hypothetical protein